MNLEPVNRIYKISVLQDSRNAATAAALNNRMTQVAASTRRVTNNARGAALATRNLGYVAQNASYQIADFFVMLQGGVGIGRALSTQLPQLLAGFGALGAVLGAAAAIGATVLVTLQNKSKVVQDLTAFTERYTDTWKQANDALFAFVETGKVGTRTLLEMKQAALEVEQVKLSELLAPPDPSAWKGFLIVWKKTFAAIGDAILAIPGVSAIISLFEAAASSLARSFGSLADSYRELDAVANADRNAVLSFIEPLINAQAGTERFAQALRLLRTEVNEFTNVFTFPAESSPFPLLDDARDRVTEVNRALSALYGTDPKKWPESAKTAWEIAQTQFKETEESVEGLVTQLGALTELQPNGLFQALFRESDLDKEIRKWDEALQAGLVTLEAANIAKDALVKIDVWEDLQDIIIDIGKTFENQIVDAMKSGKFAVADFVSYALEQFARLALSRVFEPFFLLLANSVPLLGGSASGSPSPGYGGSLLIRSAMIEPPASAAPMYNYGESISRIPGAARGMGNDGSNVTVNVNNYGNDDVEVKQANTSNGIEIDVVIKETVKAGFSGGDFDNSLASTFGLRRLGY